MDIIIIGGFLGGGKTTTLNHLIKAALQQELQPAVIMNDFGQASVDSQLVEGSVPMDEIIEGCICCAMKADVSKQLHQIYLDYQPDVVFCGM
ncbi:GTP-binding protein [Staphylococcus simulans]|uniref:GTP-binding protein n=1 Tax=Staphylococcus simulans TaxID=1286 RepID=UPI0022793610|nr:GTP-binding protein [Staphylococcus simulans]